MTATRTQPHAPGDRVGAYVRGLWHVLVPLERVEPGVTGTAMLLGERLAWTAGPDGEPVVWRVDDPQTHLPVRVDFLGVWTCLGEPHTDLFVIDEVDEPDRRIVHAGTIGVHVSAPRAVENFLDMAHFPYVHTDILGVEPHTEVAEYQVHVDASTNDIWATECVFWQPVAATTSTSGQMSEYTYRVPHPYCVMLYKTAPVDPTRRDVIALFCTPVAEDRIEAHMYLALLDDVSDEAGIRRFQQMIFAQDKPILENQHPKRLPLDPRAETPIRADKVAIAYRRWLHELGVDYAVIPAS